MLKNKEVSAFKLSDVVFIRLVIVNIHEHDNFLSFYITSGISIEKPGHLERTVYAKVQTLSFIKEIIVFNSTSRKHSTTEPLSST